MGFFAAATASCSALTLTGRLSMAGLFGQHNWTRRAFGLDTSPPTVAVTTSLSRYGRRPLAHCEHWQGSLVLPCRRTGVLCCVQHCAYVCQVRLKSHSVGLVSEARSLDVRSASCSQRCCARRRLRSPVEDGQTPIRATPTPERIPSVCSIHPSRMKCVLQFVTKSTRAWRDARPLKASHRLWRLLND